MSPTTDTASIGRHLMTIGPDDDYILIKAHANGEVTTITSLGQDDAVDLLRDLANEIEIDGFEAQTEDRIN